MNKEQSKLDVVTKLSTIIGMGLIILVIINYAVIKPIIERNRGINRGIRKQELERVIRQKLDTEEKLFYEQYKGNMTETEALKRQLDELQQKQHKIESEIR